MIHGIIKSVSDSDLGEHECLIYFNKTLQLSAICLNVIGHRQPIPTCHDRAPLQLPSNYLNNAQTKKVLDKCILICLIIKNCGFLYNELFKYSVQLNVEPVSNDDNKNL